MRNIISVLSLIICASVMAQSTSGNNKYSVNNSQSNVDLRGEFGPITDQGNIGFCGAYATADMMSYWLNKKIGFKNTAKDTRTKENMVSGLGVALVFNNDQRSDRLYQNKSVVKDAKKMVAEAGGDTQKALAQAQKKVETLQQAVYSAIESTTPQTASIEADNRTTTTENATATVRTAESTGQSPKGAGMVPEEDASVSIGNSMQKKWEEFVHACDVLNAISSPPTEAEGIYFHTPNKICFEKDIASPPKQEKAEDPCDASSQVNELFSDLNKLKVDPKNKKTMADSIKSIFPKVKSRYLAKLIKKFSKKPTFDALRRLTDKSCKNITSIMSKDYPLPAPQIVVQEEDRANVGDLFAGIDERLDAGEPVFIIYDAKLLYFYSSYGESSDDESPDNISSSGTAHASTIVGRLYDFWWNESSYIIRNTWGAESCECLKKAYVYTSDSLQKNIRDSFYSNPVINQNKDFGTLVVETYEANKEKYDNEVPFKCDKGYYLVRKSILGKYLYTVDYYVPLIGKLPKPPKLKRQKGATT